MSQFSRLLAAVEQGEHAQWKIGDALIAECGPPPTAIGKFDKRAIARIEQAAQFLYERGHEQYSVITLRQLRDTAFSFPKSRRHPHLSFGVHDSAGSPDVLDAIVAGSKRKIFGTEYVRAVRAAQRRAEE